MRNLSEILRDEKCRKKYIDLFRSEVDKEVSAKHGVRYQFDDVEYLFYASLSRFIGAENVELDKWHDSVLDWLRDTKGKNLIISGGVGIGKTLALHSIRNVVNFNKKGATMELWPYYKFKFDGGGGAFHPICEILGIDDLGCEEDKNNFGEVMNWWSKYISRNYIGRNQTFIVTTNLTPEEMYARYGARTMDRIVEMSKFVLIQSQESHRHAGFTFDKV